MMRQDCRTGLIAVALAVLYVATVIAVAWWVGPDVPEIEEMAK